MASRNTSRGCTNDELSRPRVIKMSRSNRCCASRIATWNSSTGKSCNRGAKTAATSCGPRNGTPASRASAAIRRPSSSAACTAATRAAPTPRTRCIDAGAIAASRPNDPSVCANSSRAQANADCPPPPVPITVANSSIVLNACAPNDRIRSLGRSECGNSRIVSSRPIDWLAGDDTGTPQTRGLQPTHPAALGQMARRAVSRVEASLDGMSSPSPRSRAASRNRSLVVTECKRADRMVDPFVCLNVS